MRPVGSLVVSLVLGDLVRGVDEASVSAQNGQLSALDLVTVMFGKGVIGDCCRAQSRAGASPRAMGDLRTPF